MADDTSGIGKGKRERARVKGVTSSDNPPTLLDTCAGGDDVDTSETLTGKRERAPVGGAIDSDIPIQTQGGRCRVRALRLALIAGKEVAKEHDQWRDVEMKSQMDTQSRMDPRGSVVVAGVGAVTSAWAAEWA